MPQLRNTLKRSRALLCVLVVASLIAGVLPLGSAYAAPDPHLSVLVRSADLGPAYTDYSPAPAGATLSGKHTNTPLSFKLEVTDPQSAIGTRTVTVAKPADATLTVGTDAQTTAVVGSVSGQQPGSSLATLTLKDTLPESYDIYYSVSYDPDKTADGSTFTFTADLQIGTAAVASGSATVQAACATEFYVGVAPVSQLDTLNATSRDFMSVIGSYLQPRSPARVGGSYLMRGNVFNYLPDAPANSPLGAVVNGRTPDASTLQITLPPEAVLGAYDSTEWSVTHVGGSTVLTSTGTNIPHADAARDTAMSRLDQYRPNFSVTYATAPVADPTAYVYQAKLTVTWHGDATPQVFQNSDIRHEVASTSPGAQISASATMTSDTKGPTPLASGAASLSYRPEFLHIGDVSNHRYYVKNTGDENLDDVTISLPFDGDLWDVQDMLLGTNTVPVPLSATLQSMTFTYSDGTMSSVSFADASKFDQSLLVQNKTDEAASARYIARDMPSWVMGGSSASTYITNIEIKLSSLPGGAWLLFGFQTQLRSAKHSGPAVVPDTDAASVQITASGTNASDPRYVASSSGSDTVPIAGSSTAGEYVSSQLIAATQSAFSTAAPGDTVPVTQSYRMTTPSSYDAAVQDPVIIVAVPAALSLDPSTFTLKLGTSSTAPAVPESKITYLGTYVDPATNLTVYRFRYAGDMTYRDNWLLQASYDLKVSEAALAQTFPVYGFLTDARHAATPEASSAVADVLDLDGDGSRTNNVVGLTRSLTVALPASITASFLSNGDSDGDQWKHDALLPSSFDDANLSRMKQTGTLRFTATNGYNSAATGTIITEVPKGTFSPVFTGITVSALDLATGGAVAVSPQIFYTTDPAGRDATTWAPYTTAQAAADAGATAFKITFAGNELAPAHARITVDCSYQAPGAPIANKTARAQAFMNFSVGTSHSSVITPYAGFITTATSYTVAYYQDRVGADTYLGSVNKPATPGQKITIPAGGAAGELDWKLPGGYSHGVQQGTVPYTIVYGEENTINVLYVKNRAPSVKASAVVYLLQGKSVAVGDLRTLLDVSASDPEDGKIAVSKVTVGGYSGIGFGTVNFPGVPFIVDLRVKDSMGLSSSLREAAIYVLDKNTPLDPLTPQQIKSKGLVTPPMGYAYYVDQYGNVVIARTTDTIVPLTPASSGGGGSGGDTVKKAASGSRAAAGVTLVDPTGDMDAIGLLATLSLLATFAALLAAGPGRRKAKDA